MAFQKQVNKTQALGSAGQISKAFHNYCNTFSAVATDGNVCVGCFVQAGTNDGEVKGASGQAITTKILGVVVKDKYINSCGTEAVHIYRQGDNVTILNAGNIFIKVLNFLFNDTFGSLMQLKCELCPFIYSSRGFIF